MKPSTLWLAVIVLLRVFAAAPVQAETGMLMLRVEVRSISPVAGEPAQLHRILVGLPVVSLSSARGKADVERRLARAADAVSAAGCRFQLIRARSVCNLLAHIEDDTLIIDLGQLDAVPTAPAAAQNFTVAFEYNEPPSVVLQKLTVEASTDSVGGSNATEEPLVALTHSEALQRLNRSPAAALEGVSIHLRYTQADRSRGARTQPFAQRRIEDALIEAALRALDPVQAEGLVPMRLIPDDEKVLGKLDDRINELLFSGIRNWPSAANVQYVTEERTEASVKIRVRMVKFARIDVERGLIENEKGELVSFRGADDRLEREIREDIRRTEDALTEALRTELEHLEGAVPFAAEVSAVREALRKRREIQGNPRVEAFDGNLVFKVTRAWVLGKLDAKVNASFSAEDLLTGEGTLTGEKLLYNLFKHDLGETYSYTLRTGSTLQETEFVLGFPRTRGTNWITNFGGDFTALYTRDSKQLLGASSGAGDRNLIEREKGFKPRAYFEVRKDSEAKSPWTSLTRFEALLDARNVLLRADDGSADLTNGRLTAPTLRLRQAFGYSPAAAVENGGGHGIGNIAFTFTAEARKGITHLGGDFDFRQYLVSGQVESFFGFRSRRDFLVRYRQGIGASSTQTPLYQVFRLGGGNSLRGIEEGEFFGRGIGFAQADAGVNVKFLWNLIRRPKPPDPAQTAAEVPQLPISLDQIYIAFLYDRAVVSDAPRPGDLLNFEHPFSGSGIAAEVRGLNAGPKRVNLSIGYARSRQSIVHRKGLMTIGVSFDLF